MEETFKHLIEIKEYETFIFIYLINGNPDEYFNFVMTLEEEERINLFEGRTWDIILSKLRLCSISENSFLSLLLLMLGLVDSGFIRRGYTFIKISIKFSLIK